VIVLIQKKADVSTFGEKQRTAMIEVEGAVCRHLDECQRSKVVLYYLDRCSTCDIAEKFKK
jgi:DNA replicative helicase MCM subunit Mcm2 (Cdc46/Mcm family)